MGRSSKPKNGERNYSCLNYSDCLTEAAISNSNFICTGCDRAITQSFNDLLKNESNVDGLESILKKQTNSSKTKSKE